MKWFPPLIAFACTLALMRIFGHFTGDDLPAKLFKDTAHFYACGLLCVGTTLIVLGKKARNYRWEYPGWGLVVIGTGLSLVELACFLVGLALRST